MCSSDLCLSRDDPTGEKIGFSALSIEPGSEGELRVRNFQIELNPKLGLKTAGN